ncbi:helix-turn-helix transcriptional regulator [Methylocystis parvus]|uniref:helix-turn-helix transcriptional regulator n=1 Tax=Methylocystis parvus TaxID=134 RepID=UPI003C7916A0
MATLDSPSREIFTTEPDEAVIAGPGWDIRAYRLRRGSFGFLRRARQIAPGLSLEESHLRSGGLRIEGALRARRLQIGFFESEEFRLLGSPFYSGVMCVAYSGSFWETVANLPGSGLTVNFAESMLERVVPLRTAPLLLARLNGPLGASSALLPLNAAGLALERKARALMNEEAPEGLEERAAAAQELIDLGVALVDTLLCEPESTIGPPARHELAVAVERMLWKSPQADGYPLTSLEDAAARLGVSRRTIQLALQEHFGIGFVALKRAIRLQQARAALRSLPRKQVLDIAHAHGFHHFGRFARYYREMFGHLPSAETAGP